MINETKITKSQDQKFDFDDILIEPAITTEISSRSTITITYHHEYLHSVYEHLPLITAPMDTVVSKENRDFFISNNINICYPRGIETERYNINGKMCFVSYSLNDFIAKFIDNDYEFKNDEEINICIDTANGHIDTLKKSISIAKDKYGKRLVIMAGNVANPYSYVELSKAGCSFVRLGIGNGNGCFLGGTEVLTQDGHKKIEDIEIGEMVLTHKGNFKEVIAKVNYLSQEEEIYDINNIKCTENHEFLVIDKKNKNLINEKNYLDYSFWIPASEIDENIHMILELDMNE